MFSVHNYISCDEIAIAISLFIETNIMIQQFYCNRIPAGGDSHLKNTAASDYKTCIEDNPASNNPIYGHKVRQWRGRP